MAAGDATATDVPGKYDVVINGKGYCLLDSLEESIPFRTHRAVYGFTPPFVERQNVSNSYGDNAQDFFLTIRQRDWSLGEQQKFFRAGTDGRYWMGSNVDVSTPGQVSLSAGTTGITFPAAVRACCRERTSGDITTVSTTNLYRVTSTSGAITDLGAHGLGAAPGRWGICNDGNNVYISSTTAGTVGTRKYTGAAYSTFSAGGCDSLAFLNNTLYGYQATLSRLILFDTAGTVTGLFTWQAAEGSAASVGPPRLCSFGGRLLIAFPYAQESSELWIYDGSGVSRLEVFPENFIISEIEVLYGVAYIGGSFTKPSGSNNVLRSAVLFYDGSQIGKLWQANDFNSSTVTTANLSVGPHPAMGINNGRLIFTDETLGNLMAYDPASGGVSTVGTFTPNAGDSGQIASSGQCIVHTRNQVGGYYYPATTYPSSGYVISSLIDFDSSLKKVFRGATIEFDSAADGNGGSVDVSYQIGGLAGSWTSLATGVTSGTEITFPASTTGHSIALKVTLNKGTSTSGPLLKTMSLRGAPVMPEYPHGEYILDCTNTEDDPRQLRDESYHPLTGYEQAQNLTTAAKSQVPITITDKLNGTFTGFVDINDAQGFDVYEIHPAEGDLKKAGSYVVRLTVRGV